MAASSISSTSVALVALMKLKGVGRRGALRIVHGPIPDNDAKDLIVDRAMRARISESAFLDAWDRAWDELESTEAKETKFFSF
ncbi:MAG: hypothetical protein E5X65_38440, partial [Mesorhizobium sp.]